MKFPFLILRGHPGGPVVENLPASVLIPHLGRSHMAAGQLSPYTTPTEAPVLQSLGMATTKPMHHHYWTACACHKWREPACSNKDPALPKTKQINPEALLRVHPWMSRVDKAEWTFSRTGLSFKVSWAGSSSGPPTPPCRWDQGKPPGGLLGPALVNRPVPGGWEGRQASSLTWIKPQHQEAEEQGSQQALTEGQRKEVADCRVPKLAQQRQ